MVLKLVHDWRLRKQGKSLWRSGYSLPKRLSQKEARIATRSALIMVKKFAPEAKSFGNILQVEQNYFSGSAFCGFGESRFSDSYNGCCSNTFSALSEHSPPPLEQALTIYLYWKYFPERFKNRPLFRFKANSRMAALFASINLVSCLVILGMVEISPQLPSGWWLILLVGGFVINLTLGFYHLFKIS
jgi:hypothetical protein